MVCSIDVGTIVIKASGEGSVPKYRRNCPISLQS